MPRRLAPLRSALVVSSLLASSLGCRSRPPERAAAVARASSPTDPCGSIRAENEAAIARGLEGATLFDGRPATRADVPFRPFCAPYADGAWAAVVQEIGFGGVNEVHWQLVHIERATGERTVLVDPSEPLYDGCCSPTNETTFGALQDFDGDGHPEILLDRSWEGPEGGMGRRPLSFTLRDGVVRPFEFPFAFDTFRDVDGDGLLDGIIGGDASEEKMCEWGWEAFSAPPTTIRFVPGRGFPLDDPETRRRARETCPERPKAIVVKTKGFVDDEATARAVVCARIWGVDAKTIETALENECTDFAESIPDGVFGDTCTDAIATRRPNECRHRRALIWAAEVTPAIP